MRYSAIDPRLFRRNRARLVEKLLPNSLVILNSNDIPLTNGDGTLPITQNADLFYLSGVDQEETILLLYPDALENKNREILFVRETSEELETWEGHKLTKTEATRMSGITRVEWLSSFPTLFHRFMCECDHIYLNSNEHPRAVVEVETRDARFIHKVQTQYPLHGYRRLAPLMAELRLVKSEDEIRLMRKACAITEAGFRRAAKFLEPGANEMEVEAEFAHEFIRSGASFAYSPIVASGANSCVLHYLQNNQVSQNGDLLLLDVGASYANYKSDLSRTLPVSGKFSRRQREVYEAVLRVLRGAIKGMKPGRVMRHVHRETQEAMTEELVDLKLLTLAEVKEQDPDQPACLKYFMHGTGHSLGLDTHDLGDMTKPMAPGWVLTCEPGIYIPAEKIGIRLENNILITQTGNVDLFADVPVEAEEIEALMAG